MEQDVFICHSSNDLDTYVRGIYDFLRKKGVECFCSSIKEEGYIRPGEHWLVSVAKILKNCKYLIFIVSDNSLNSQPIITELTEAYDRKVVIIPYITEKHIEWPKILDNKDIFTGIGMVLRQIESINASDEPLTEQNLMRLVEVIRGEQEEDETQDEKKYKAIVKRFLSDGKIETSEKSILENLAKGFEISPDRAEELEKIVREELGLLWPAAGIDFLRHLSGKLQNDPLLKSLDFLGDKEIESTFSLRWFFNKKDGLGIRLIKWGKGIRVRLGLFSENAKIDPEFKRIADNLTKQKILKEFEFYPNKKLRISYHKFIEPKKLDQKEFRTEIYDKFLDFCKKIEPFLNMSVSGNDKILAEETDKESNGAGKVQISDDPNKNLKHDSKQETIEESYRIKVKEVLEDGVMTDLESTELDSLHNKLKLSDEDALRIFDEVLEEMKKIDVESQKVPYRKEVINIDIQKPEQIHPKQKLSLKEIDNALIKALQIFGGAAKKIDVEQKVYNMLQNSFREPWYQEDSTPGIQRWRHQVNWARNRARESGLIKPTEESGRGYWELTEKGKKEPVT